MTISSLLRKTVRGIIGTSAAREQAYVDQDDRAEGHALSAAGQLATVAPGVASAGEGTHDGHTAGTAEPSSSTHAQQHRPDDESTPALGRAEAARREAAGQLPSSVPFRVVDGTFVGDHRTATLLRAVGGGEAILRVTTLFYQRMFADPHLSQVGLDGSP